MSNYSGTFEAKVSSIKVIDEDAEVKVPTILQLNAENPDLVYSDAIQSARVHIEDAIVSNVEIDNNDNVDISFVIGDNTKEYLLHLDSRYNELTPTEGLKVGYTFTTDTFVSVYNDNLQFTYIDGFEYTENVVELESITISGPQTVDIGSTIQLNAEAAPVGSILDGLVWSSENPDIATVEASTGVVSGVAEGTATIKATSGAISATYSVEVQQPTHTEKVSLDWTNGWNAESSLSESVFGSAVAADDLMTLLNEGGENVSAVSNVNKVYSDKNLGGIKLSTKSANGTIDFVTTKAISKIEFTVIAWKNDSAKLECNGEEQSLKNKTGVLADAETLSYVFSAPTDTISLKATKRLAIIGISLYF